MKEMIIQEQKLKHQLQTQIKDGNKQKESLTREIESLKNDNNYKVKIMENDIEHIHVVKENNINIIRKKIEAELSNQNTLLQQIDETKISIDHYNKLMGDIRYAADKDEDVLKQSAEMTKFLSQI